MSGWSLHREWLVTEGEERRDYHGNVGGALFLHYWDELLDQLPAGKWCIVMDRASYHRDYEPGEGKTEVKTTGKARMLAWLRARGVPEEELKGPGGRDGYKSNKALKALIDEHWEQPTSITIKRAQERGVEVVFTPPGCFDLNMIERIWGVCKNSYRKQQLPSAQKMTMAQARLAVNGVGSVLDAVAPTAFIGATKKFLGAMDGCTPPGGVNNNAQVGEEEGDRVVGEGDEEVGGDSSSEDESESDSRSSSSESETNQRSCRCLERKGKRQSSSDSESDSERKQQKKRKRQSSSSSESESENEKKQKRQKSDSSESDSESE